MIRSPVARFHLYGETFGESGGHRPAHFVHVETIRARSEPRDWTIGEHTHAGLAQLIVITAGGVLATLDDRIEHRPAPVVLAIPAGAVHGFAFDPDTEGHVVSLADGQLDSSPMGAWIRVVLFERGATVPLSADVGDRVTALGDQLLAEHTAPAAGSDVVVQALLHALLVVVARTADAVDVDASGEAGADVTAADLRRPDLYREFRDAVEQHLTEHWSVEQYASALGVSASTLDRACRRVAGTSAFEVTQERLELEARRRLRYTGVPVQQLAADLGFADPSYFARFVRRRTGSTPSAHRSG